VNPLSANDHLSTKQKNGSNTTALVYSNSSAKESLFKTQEKKKQRKKPTTTTTEEATSDASQWRDRTGASASQNKPGAGSFLNLYL
jgi:hypothetical protein